MNQLQRDEVLKVLMGREAIENGTEEQKRVLRDFALEDVDAIDKLFERWLADRDAQWRARLKLAQIERGAGFALHFLDEYAPDKHPELPPALPRRRRTDLPSAADLDAIAIEQRVREATK